MINANELLELQRDQYEHDMRNHFDILSLHKQERVRHYAAHFAKYAGRIARGDAEMKSVERTIVDSLLVCLSAANTLHQRLEYSPKLSNTSFFRRLTDAAGRFNDASEKIDHLEAFLDIALLSNQDICDCVIDEGLSRGMNLVAELEARRSTLRQRHFYIR